MKLSSLNEDEFEDDDSIYDELSDEDEFEDEDETHEPYISATADISLDNGSTLRVEEWYIDSDPEWRVDGQRLDIHGILIKSARQQIIDHIDVPELELHLRQSLGYHANGPQSDYSRKEAQIIQKVLEKFPTFTSKEELFNNLSQNWQEVIANEWIESTAEWHEY